MGTTAGGASRGMLMGSVTSQVILHAARRRPRRQEALLGLPGRLHLDPGAVRRLGAEPALAGAGLRAGEAGCGPGHHPLRHPPLRGDARLHAHPEGSRRACAARPSRILGEGGRCADASGVEAHDDAIAEGHGGDEIAESGRQGRPRPRGDGHQRLARHGQGAARQHRRAGDPGRPVPGARGERSHERRPQDSRRAQRVEGGPRAGAAARRRRGVLGHRAQGHARQTRGIWS